MPHLGLGQRSVMQDYYRVLGLAEDADLAAIRQAFRRLVMEAHPDRAVGDPLRTAEAERRTKALIQAYRTLAHQERRRRYDAAKKPARPAAPCPVDLVYFNPSGQVRQGRRGIGQFTLRNLTQQPLRIAVRFAETWIRPKYDSFGLRGQSAEIVILDLDGKGAHGVPPGTHLSTLLVQVEGVEYPARVPIEVKAGW